MTTAFDSFDESPLGAFVQTSLDARNEVSNLILLSVAFVFLGYHIATPFICESFYADVFEQHMAEYRRRRAEQESRGYIIGTGVVETTEWALVPDYASLVPCRSNVGDVNIPSEFWTARTAPAALWTDVVVNTVAYFVSLLSATPSHLDVFIDSAVATVLSNVYQDALRAAYPNAAVFVSELYDRTYVHRIFP